MPAAFDLRPAHSERSSSGPRPGHADIGCSPIRATMVQPGEEDLLLTDQVRGQPFIIRGQRLREQRPKNTTSPARTPDQIERSLRLRLSILALPA